MAVPSLAVRCSAGKLLWVVMSVGGLWYPGVLHLDGFGLLDLHYVLAQTSPILVVGLLRVEQLKPNPITSRTPAVTEERASFMGITIANQMTKNDGLVG
jgi:hypothetical protein